MDFTFEKYEEFLKKISEIKIPVYTVYDWITKKPEYGILLRHDADRKPENSLKTAKLENKYDIKSTFYFRIVKSSFKPYVISEIRKLNHEIGYHYEDLSLAKGNYAEAIKIFEKNLNKLRKYGEISTISMHGRPLSPFDNRDLWGKYDFKEFDIKAEAFLSIDYSDIFYFTDTGRSWKENSANLRDKVKNGLKADIKNTDELINFILHNKDKKIAVITHPERWSDTIFEYFLNSAKDIAVNFVKRILKLIR